MMEINRNRTNNNKLLLMGDEKLRTEMESGVREYGV